MRAFEHFTPNTLTEALQLLARWNGRACVYAGGTDLLPRMKGGTAAWPAVVNIKQLRELQDVRPDDSGGVTVGALTTLRALTRSAVIREHHPVVAEAAGLMASEQVRSFATLGGNLCNASPSADLAPPLLVADAVARLVGVGGERRLPLQEFFRGPGQSALQSGELLRDLYLPPPRGRAVYLKHTAREYMDIAVVGVAVRLTLEDGLCQEVRIALGAVAPVPLRAMSAERILSRHPLTQASIAASAAAAAEECNPIDDGRGSARYRKRMVGVLVARILHGWEAT